MANFIFCAVAVAEETVVERSIDEERLVERSGNRIMVVKDRQPRTPYKKIGKIRIHME